MSGKLIKLKDQVEMRCDVCGNEIHDLDNGSVAVIAPDVDGTNESVDICCPCWIKAIGKKSLHQFVLDKIMGACA